MKKIFSGIIPLVIITSLFLFSCGPTDDKGGMDTDNSGGQEGIIDSTRLTNFDSLGITNTSPTDSTKVDSLK